MCVPLNSNLRVRVNPNCVAVSAAGTAVVTCPSPAAVCVCLSVPQLDFICGINRINSRGLFRSEGQSRPPPSSPCSSVWCLVMEEATHHVTPNSVFPTDSKHKSVTSTDEL